MIELQSKKLSKQDALVQSLQFVSDDNQSPVDTRMSAWVALTPEVVMGVLEKLLCQDKPVLNDEALHQEGMRLYHLIEPVFPFQRYQGVEMSLEIARSFVLQSLRKSGSSLGDESQFDRLFLLWSRDSQ